MELLADHHFGDGRDGMATRALHPPRLVAFGKHEVWGRPGASAGAVFSVVGSPTKTIHRA